MKKPNRRQLWLIAIALLVFAALKVALITWYLQHKKPATPTPVIVSCASTSNDCLLPDGSRLRFVTPPHASQPFDISLSKQDDVAPSAAFSMQNMDMGFNRYHFVAQGNQWRAHVTLPLCVTGDHAWLLDIQHGDQIFRIAFTTV